MDADGVIVAGPDVGIRWPCLWEHKALGQKSWTDLNLLFQIKILSRFQ